MARYRKATPPNFKLDFKPLWLRRIEADLTRNDLASAIGVNGITLWRWETNRNVPSVAQLLALSRALGVPAQDLVRVVELGG